MADILLNYGHITHLMMIICTPWLFLASCIRLFDRLSAIDVFGHQQMSPIGHTLKNDASKPELFEDVLLLETLVIIAALKCSRRQFRRRHVPPSNDFCDSKKPCNRIRLQGLNVLVEHIARRSDYADGRGPLETRMVIVAPAAALEGVWPTTFPVATLSS